jgi:hypothetical protein
VGSARASEAGAAAQEPSERLVAAGPLWGGRIRPSAEVGRGATGMVLRGTDVKLRREVALKVTALPRGELPTALYARFVEEAQITAQLEHPNVVPIHDFGVDPKGHAYFSMKLVRGQSLKSILDKRAEGDPATMSEFGLRRLLDVFLQVCQALEYAHARGVVHRDLKPANIMVGDFGEVLVMDWGIAKLIGRKERAAPRPEQDVSSVRAEGDALATQHGMVLGTPAYMAPEQARGDEVDERSDLYSLGVILYEVLCSHVPFDADDPMKIVSRVLTEEPRPPSEYNRHTPPTLEVLALHLLEKDPELRPRGIGPVRSLVHDYIEGIGREYRRESMWKNVLWLFGAVGLFAFFIWYLTGQSIATIVALTPSAVFNAIGWLLLVMAARYPLWGATTSLATSGREHDRFRPPTSVELFVSGYLAHRTFAASITPLFQLIFIVEPFVIAFPYVPEGAFDQLRGAWANALIVIIVFLFAYLFLFSMEVRFARRIDRYVRLLRRPRWETAWPFVLIVVVLSTVVATDVIDWTPSHYGGDVWAYMQDRVLTQQLDPFGIVKTLVFQGTFLVGLVIAAMLLTFPFAELLASLRMAYQPVDQASIASRKRYFLRSLAVSRISGTNFLYAGAMIGSLTGLTILSGESRGSLVQQVVYVLGPSLIGFLGFLLIRRKAASLLASAAAVRRMLDEQLELARDEHRRADLDQIAVAPWRRRLLQVAVPLVCVIGYLAWTGSGVHREAIKELILPVGTGGWLLILPYALLVPLLLVRDPVHLWILRRRVGREDSDPA